MYRDRNGRLCDKIISALTLANVRSKERDRMTFRSSFHPNGQGLDLCCDKTSEDHETFREMARISVRIAGAFASVFAAPSLYAPRFKFENQRIGRGTMRGIPAPIPPLAVASFCFRECFSFPSETILSASQVN